MANDGSVRIKVDLDIAKADKKLGELISKINNAEKSLEGRKKNASNLQGLLTSQAKEAEAALKEYEKIKAEFDAALSGEKSKIKPKLQAAKKRLDSADYAATLTQSDLEKETAAIEKETLALQKLREAAAEAATTKLDMTGEANAMDQQAAESAAKEEIDAKKVRQAEQAARETEAMQRAYEGVKRSFTGIIGLAGKALSAAVRGLGAIAKKGVQAAKSIMSFGLGLNKSMSLLKTFVLAGLGTQGLYALFRKLFSSLKEGFQVFAQADTETRKNVESLNNALGTLKLSLGGVVAPIFNAVAPALNALISLLTRAANAVASLFAAFRGGATFQAAADGANAMAKGVGAAGSAAKEAKKQLAGFDELNVLSDDKSGGSGGGGTRTQTTEISGPIKDFAAQLRSLWDGGFYYELGRTVAQKLNSMIEGIDWAGIGQNIGAKIDALFKMAAGFIRGFDFLAVGLDIGTLVNNLLNRVDWANLGTIIGAKLYALGNILAGILINTDWYQVVDAIFQVVDGFFTTLDWSTLMANLATGIGNALGGIAERLWEIVQQAWQSFHDTYLAPFANEAGELTIKGVYQGIKNALKDIGAWIKKHIWEPFKNAFCEAFGIHSPSTKAMEWGNMIIEGLAQGITDKIARIKQAVEDVKAAVVEKFEGMKQKLSGIVDNIKSLFNFEFKIPQLRLPHLQVTWQNAGDLARFFGISAIPHLSVSWYARGGIVDGASLIGAGEDGAEAIVPLENHTEWIDKVADGLLSRMTQRSFLDALTSAFVNTPLPALATGSILPPNAAYASGGGDWANSLLTKVNELQEAVNRLASQPLQVDSKIYLDRRQVGESVTEYQRDKNRAGGR